MMTKTWTGWGVLAVLAGLAGCAGGSRGVAKSAPQPPHSRHDVFPQGASAHGWSGQPPATPSVALEPSAAEAQSSAEAAPPAMDEAEPSPSPSERPGLGTEWGETRYSHVYNVSFDRADENHPAEVLRLYYNDREGARAMAHYDDYREVGNAVVFSDALALSVSLNDAAGRPLPAFFADGHTYAIGEAGERYTIAVTNRSGQRVEAVASVDGLDVLDGRNADFGKRGYLVPAWGSVEIDGFRQSDDHVAAFRFGSVRDSYAARTGSDRNVGVIGVALFPPRGAPRWPWTERESERRRTADPFPGKYASPPPPRW